MTRKEFFKRLLVSYWLRPESALWYAHEAFLTQEAVAAKLKSPSLELGCMDGTSSFIMLGGEFGLAFDVYQIGRNQDGKVDIKTKPRAKFDLGMTWKKEHLVEAERLGIYGKLIEHDLNKPLTMLENNRFATVWAPNFYWVDALQSLVTEVHRVLRQDGRLITVLPDLSALSHMIYQFKEKVPDGWIQDLDRGRYAHVARQARTLEQWKKFFEENKFKISRHERYLPNLILRVNDIGLRPLFPVLRETYEALQGKARGDFERIKQSWIDTIYHFLSPLCETDWMNLTESDTVWHLFELTPVKA